MKLMIASDIHGSALYCECLLSAFEREGADRLVLLGDLLYHGPRNDLPDGYAPKEVAAMLNASKRRLLAIRGNCDTEVDQMVLDFPILSDSLLLFIGGRTVFATHGHHLNPDALPPLCPGDLLLYGHTHIPDISLREGILCLNPGSVSIPKGGSERSYLILTDDRVSRRNLDGQTLSEDRLSTLFEGAPSD